MDVVRIACPHCHKRLKLLDRHQLGRKVKCPKCGQRFLAREQASADQTPFSTVPKASAQSSEQVQIDPSMSDAVARWKRVRQRRRSGFRPGWAAAVVMGVIAISVAFWWQRSSQDVDATTTSLTSTPSQLKNSSPPVNEVRTGQQMLSGRNGELFTSEKLPVQLLMVPSGARIVLHLRPAKLWSDDPRMKELRSCLTEKVVRGIERELRSVTHREPADIEEVLLVWILGARGSEPQLATVVRLAREEKLSDLIEEFGGDPLDPTSSHRLYLHDRRAVLIKDQRTLAFAPRELASELAESADSPNVNTTDGILALLAHTNRDRLLTFVCEPADVLRHLDRLAPPSSRDLARRAALWFENDVETVAWSIDIGEAFTSEILLRGRSTTSSASVSDHALKRLEDLPHSMVSTAETLNPSTIGLRRIIGRFPAMLEVFRRATVTAIEDRMVRLHTILPAKAGPNLVLATVLTWNQTLQPHSNSVAESSELVARELVPPTLYERLQRQVDAEFNRVPLQDALDFIAGEIGVTIRIDGDALKHAGYTKNMPQSFKLGRIPAVAALRKIVGQYQETGKEMVVAVDTEQQQVTITTRKFAERRGQAILDLNESF